ARLRGDTAERTGRRRWPHEGVGIGREPRHARLVAEDRAAGAGRGRIDGKDSDLVALTGEIGAERVDGGRLARAWRPGDADAHGFAGAREQLLHQLMRSAAVV